jgi:uncharacterized protein YcfL
MKKLIVNTVILLSVAGLVACGGDDYKKRKSSSSSSSLASSSAASSIAQSTAMELNKEYPYSESTKITNTGTTALIVTKKHYWEGNKTVVILQQGSATIE